MLTRSKARALVAENTTVIVSPSATGQGTHTRWKYPVGRAPYPSSPSPPSESGSWSPSSSRTGSTESLSSGPHSSLSTLSDSSLSSLSSISDTSFHTAFSQPQQSQPQIPPPATPAAPQSPRRLQRSPAIRRYIYGSTHILTEAPPTLEPPMRDSMMERKLEEVFQREWDTLMKSKQMAVQAYHAYETDDEDSAMDTGDEGYIRGDTEPVEDFPPRAGPSRLPRPLGPYGTEIIDHETFKPLWSDVNVLPVYPQKWVSSRKSLKYQPTEEFSS